MSYRKIPSSLELFLVPEKELSLKLFADNLRTLAVALLLSGFAAKFKSVGLRLLTSDAPSQSGIQYSESRIAFNVDLIYYSVGALGLAFSVLAVVQAYAILTRLLGGSMALHAGETLDKPCSKGTKFLLHALTGLYPMLVSFAAAGLFALVRSAA